MDFITTLWQPILLSAVLVFVASSVIWMATPIHKNDFKGAGDKEDGLLSAVKSAGLAPGVYFIPFCQGKGAEGEKAAAKIKSGPWAQLIVLPEWPSMGKTLGFWFAHLVIVSAFVAYVVYHANLGPTPRYLDVFRMAGSAAFLAYAGYAAPMCIWHAIPWRQLPGRVFDGIVYALLTAGCFGWLMPHA